MADRRRSDAYGALVLAGGLALGFAAWSWSLWLLLIVPAAVVLLGAAAGIAVGLYRGITNPEEEDTRG